MISQICHVYIIKKNMTTMKLLPEYFEKIKQGTKTVEIRLNDEKRQKIQVGDVIRFSKLPKKEETLEVEVVELLRFDSFADMYRTIPHDMMGVDGGSVEELVESTYEIYTREEEKEYGVLGIKIKLKLK